MVGREDAGFFGRLEDVVLFEDDADTKQFPTTESLDAKLEDEGVQNDRDLHERLLLKRKFFKIRSSFPYDLINLDFCQYYYPEPPGVLRINETVARILKWQSEADDKESKELRIQNFILAVTCKYDEHLPVDARKRLREIVLNNYKISPEYKEKFSTTRNVGIRKWVTKEKEDVFFSGWPKDIVRTATEAGWSSEILDYVYYQREGDRGNPYTIVCLIVNFIRSRSADYISAAVFALAKENRIFIDDVDRNSRDGKQLVGSLRSIVSVRNLHARKKGIIELPDPLMV
jgi:hypothetical protein